MQILMTQPTIVKLKEFTHPINIAHLKSYEIAIGYIPLTEEILALHSTLVA